MTLYDRTSKLLPTSYPSVYEQCHEKGAFIANMEHQITTTKTVSAGIGLKELGFSWSYADTNSQTIKWSRNVEGEYGVEAEHTLYKRVYTDEGITYIQVLFSNGEEGYFWPNTFHYLDDMDYLAYPWDFKVEGVKTTLVMKREIISRKKKCN